MKLFHKIFICLQFLPMLILANFQFNFKKFSQVTFLSSCIHSLENGNVEKRLCCKSPPFLINIQGNHKPIRIHIRARRVWIIDFVCRNIDELLVYELSDTCWEEDYDEYNAEDRYYTTEGSFVEEGVVHMETDWASEEV